MTTPEAPNAARPPRRSRVPRWLRVLIPMVLALAWLAVAGVGGSSFSEVNEVADNDQAQHLPSSAEATEVQELQAEFRDSDVVPAVLVYQRSTGLTMLTGFTSSGRRKASATCAA